LETTVGGAILETGAGAGVAGTTDALSDLPGVVAVAAAPDRGYRVTVAGASMAAAGFGWATEAIAGVASGAANTNGRETVAGVSHPNRSAAVPAEFT
jgi:hypothetical protein